jgi:endonuclease/exonuclease/phosphatase family metal-dependent hydrolase
MPGRSRFGSLLIPFWILAGCSSDESSSPPAPTGQDVAIDTFNLYLAGAFAPYEAERRQPIIDAVAAMDSDIVCIQEAWRKSDKDAIVAGAKGRFPYAVSFDDTLATALNDPQDQNGKVPAAPTAPPCAAQEQLDKLNVVLDCVKEKCSTIPGSDEGMTTDTGCVVKECVSAAAALLYGNTADLKCYGCAATQLPTDTLKTIKEKCTTNPNAGLAFDGQAGVMLLSKFPLEGAEQWVIPGTWNRRVILRATAKLSGGLSVDVYCNHLPSVFYQPAFPYTGDYGLGDQSSKGWENELMLDAQKLVAWVQTRSGSNRAVILGDFNASPEMKDYAIEPDGAAAYDYLKSQFTEAVPADFKPKCTYCGKGENFLAGPMGPNTWIDHIFVKNIPATAAKSYERRFTQAVVAVPASDAGADAGPAAVALSDHFGVHTVISIQP